ncbi:MAG: hypothetical protein EOP56_13005 [Sphingobacteriales bacterium]|nr:MAG: hypothetical protein EOP56_13005 [Sphingobacteriales bacterium]
MVTASAILAIIFLVFRGSAIEYAIRHKLIAQELKARSSEYGMGRTTALIRRHWGLAFDKEQLLLLFVKMESGHIETELINLNYLHHCKIVQKNNVTQPCIPFHKEAKEYIEQIFLEIQLSTPKGRFHIPFYDGHHDRLSEMKTLFQKAWHWQRMIQRHCNM